MVVQNVTGLFLGLKNKIKETVCHNVLYLLYWLTVIYLIWFYSNRTYLFHLSQKLGWIKPTTSCVVNSGKTFYGNFYVYLFHFSEISYETFLSNSKFKINETLGLGRNNGILTFSLLSAICSLLQSFKVRFTGIHPVIRP